MKTQSHSTVDPRPSAFSAFSSLLLAAITLFATTARAPAQIAGTALSFDGTNDFVDLGTVAPVLGPRFTQEAWIKPQISDYGYHGFLGCTATQGDLLRAPCIFVHGLTGLHGGLRQRLNLVSLGYRQRPANERVEPCGGNLRR